MGSSPCSCNICKTKFEQFNFPNTESIPQLDKNGFVIKIQSHFRRYSSRKKFKRLLIRKLEKKRRIILSSISFQESWDLYFKSKSEFDFSYEGLEQIKQKIEEFYSDFFTMRAFGQKIILLNQLIQIKSGNEFKEEFKKWIFTIMKSDYFLGTTCDHIYIDNVIIETIDQPEEPILRKTLTNVNDATKDTPVKVELSIEPKKEDNSLRSTITASPSKVNNTSMIQRKQKLKLTKQPLIGHKKLFELLTKKALEKQRFIKEKILLFEPKNNTIMLNNILKEIKEIQNQKCTSISYKDNFSKVSYGGSYNSYSQKKEGLGSEYMIDSLEGGIYKYCGTYLDNVYHGIGMLIKENGEMYYGEWRNGLQSGFGYYYSDNSYYIGFFKNNSYHGYGELHIKEKFSYHGTWKEGKQDGIGFYQSKTMNTYCGEFFDGRISGKGYFKWNEGQTYLGTWKDDQMDGYGEFVYQNGDVYKGNYKNDMKHGTGVYIFGNGMLLKGKWIKGNKEGDFYFNFPNNPMPMLIKYEDDIQLNR